MARPSRSSPNHRGARSDHRRVPHMGRCPPPPGWCRYNVPEPPVIQMNHLGWYTHNGNLMLHRPGEGLPSILEEHEWQRGPFGLNDYFCAVVEERAPIEEEIPSTLLMELDSQLLSVLLPRWSTKTHTFVTSLGEFGPTLEDVDVSLCLKLLGEVDWEHYRFNGKEEGTLVSLQRGYTAACTCGMRWLEDGLLEDFPRPKYFTGPGIDFTLAAFLVLWLSRYVVDGRPQDGVNIFDCQLRSQGWYDVVTHLDTSILQMFVYEHFPNIAPISNVFAEVLEGSFERDLSGKYILNELGESIPRHQRQ
ncbi:hypothetical protein Acr_16g0004870 [Actinidia rufa]|uniref:Aminotransferase-like plant mobile domain-containing protein n=1 Tax=Actinidia rufa TaxID=165716 RepID=A0A7J0FYV4_9ERIC|nr:hypothetical protein Acr_16g0004870 [Actinidia rufa]